MDAVPDGRDSVSSALESVLARYGRLLKSIGRGRGLSEPDLDELCQDVRIRLWRALSAGEKIEAAAASYVYRAALSAAVDLIRRRRADREDPLDATPTGAMTASAPGPEQALDRAELGARIARAVDDLATPRDVVVRLYLSGYRREEIAALLGWTEPKTRSLLYRGLADLRAKLEADGVRPGRPD